MNTKVAVSIYKSIPDTDSYFICNVKVLCDLIIQKIYHTHKNCKIISLSSVFYCKLQETNKLESQLICDSFYFMFFCNLFVCTFQVFLGFLCLSVALSKSVAQEARPETNTSLVWSPVFNEGSEFHTPTNKPSDLPTNGHNVLQLDPVM